MSFPRYEQYKDSGVEWLGEVPEHWEVRRISQCAAISGGGTPSRDKLEYWDGDIPWISPKDMKSEKISASLETITPLGVQESTTIVVHEGSVLVVIRSGILKHSIPIAINTTPVAINQDLKAFQFDRDLCTPSYFQRWVQGLREVLRLHWMSEGATVESFDVDRIKNTLMATPPKSEQTTIAAFLDHETAKIDALVEEQRRLIELLKEKRQAVISHAVTKGLNPDAPMKDSGVEWLGEVPEHWEVKLLRRFDCMVQSGPFGSQLHAHEYVDGETPIINPVNLVNGKIEPNHKTTVDQNVLARLGHQRVKSGDIVFSRRGDLGRCAIVTQVEEGWLCGTGSMIVRLYEIQYLPEFLMRYLSLNVLKKYFERESIGAIMDSLSSTTLLALPLVVPPQSEQLAISTFVEEASHRIDSLIQMAHLSITTLQERRTALISAAVTGKIDVRNHAPKTEGVPA